jgi:hypothetical protein
LFTIVEHKLNLSFYIIFVHLFPLALMAAAHLSA